MILGGGTDRGRAADVDVFDQVFQACIGSGGGLFETVEVDHHHVDGRDGMLGESALVPGISADGENAAVNFGVQGFHAAIEHLREAGDIGNIPDGDSGLANEARGAAGGDEFGAQPGQSAGKIENSRFIGDTNQNAANFGHLKER
jgi:hypothetical protein